MSPDDNATVNRDRADDARPAAPTNAVQVTGTIDLVDEETRRLVLRELAAL
jgi:hypothetical protein